MAYVWVDPPKGWKYGFPKLYNKDKHPDVREWMTMHGYPDDCASWRSYSRMWDPTEEEIKQFGELHNAVT